MSGHTLGRLRVSGTDIRAESRRIVAMVPPCFASDGKRAAADAARIVHTWNMHDDLVEALEKTAALGEDTADLGDMDDAIAAALAVLAKEKGE